MERHRLTLPVDGTLRDAGTGLQVVRSDLFLAEGLAEWMTERLLLPVLERAPIVGFGDAQKLTVLAADNASDPHALGLRHAARARGGHGFGRRRPVAGPRARRRAGEGGRRRSRRGAAPPFRRW